MECKRDSKEKPEASTISTKTVGHHFPIIILLEMAPEIPLKMALEMPLEISQKTNATNAKNLGTGLENVQTFSQSMLLKLKIIPPLFNQKMIGSKRNPWENGQKI